MTGPLIIIGGHEDKEGDRVILRDVESALDGNRLVLATIASRQPDGYLESYSNGFDAARLDELYLENDEEAHDADKRALVERAGGVFFSGGDQSRLVGMIRNTPIERAVRELWERGGVVAGTSAGASAMGELMIVRGPGDESVGPDDLEFAPGLAFVAGVMIDQHFAERGRIGRLVGAIAEHPRLLGIGIDEDTAIVVEGRRFRVIGSGAVYVLAARSAPEFTLRVLRSGDSFDLDEAQPAQH